MSSIIQFGSIALRRIRMRLYMAAQTRIALYAMLAAALINAYALLLENDLCAMLVFIASGLAASLRTKNMTIVLFTAIVGVNLLRVARTYLDKINSEGFEDEDKDEDGSEPVDNKNKPNTKVAANIENFEDIYAELMKLQNEIVEGVKRVHEPLSKVESIVNGLKESMTSINA
jgi:hypothetical protein